MIMGFTLTKILVEKTTPVAKNIRVSNDVDISAVKEQQHAFDKKQKALTFSFVFTVDYKTNIGKIVINGDILYLTDEKTSKEILSSWKTKKKIPQEVSVRLLNTIFAKCNIKALELSQELNLPPHIPLPRVTFDKQTLAESYIG